jgi:hypothetical protein
MMQMSFVVTAMVMGKSKRKENERKKILFVRSVPEQDGLVKNRQ